MDIPEDEPPICEWCNKPVPRAGELCAEHAESLHQADEGIGVDWDEADRDYWSALEDDAEDLVEYGGEG